MRYLVAAALFAVMFVVQTWADPPRKIILAEIVDTVVDVRAKDVWIFTGSVPARPGVAVGFDKNGREVRAGIPPAPKAAPTAEKVEKLASLQAACASCHTAPRVKGGFVLFRQAGAFDDAVSWPDVLAAIEPQGRNPPRMPPVDAGKPPVSAADRDLVRRLAK